MVKPTSSGNKHKKRPPRLPNDSRAFKTGLESEEKVLRHRKAQSEYYARAAERLKKRRWDPPKAKRKPGLSIFEEIAPARQSDCSGEQIATASSTFKEPFDFQDARAQTDSGMDVGENAAASDVEAAVGTAASPTSEEFLVSHALAQLAEGVASHVLQPDRYDEGQVNENAIDDWRAGSVDSNLDKANQLSSHESDAAHAAAYVAARATAHINSGSKVPRIQRGDLPAGVTPLSAVQQASLQITGNTGPLTTVQAAQLNVSMINSGDPYPTTPEDAANWCRHPTLVIDQWSRCDWTKKEVAISCWRTTVCNAVEKYRRKAAREEARQTAEDGKLGRWFQQRMREQRLATKEMEDEIWASGGVSDSGA